MEKNPGDVFPGFPPVLLSGNGEGHRLVEGIPISGQGTAADRHTPNWERDTRIRSPKSTAWAAKTNGF
jgi:hypothetical protein